MNNELLFAAVVPSKLGVIGGAIFFIIAAILIKLRKKMMK
jgi:hypothetical protein